MNYFIMVHILYEPALSIMRVINQSVKIDVRITVLVQTKVTIDNNMIHAIIGKNTSCNFQPTRQQ